MNTWIDSLSKSEQRTRKHWFYLTICHSCYVPLILLIYTVIITIEQPCHVFLIIIPLVLGLIPAIQIGTLWHCAYKKPGTRLLTLSVIIGPLRMLLILGGFKDISNPLQPLCALFDFCFFLYWYVMTLKMRKINKAIQKQSHPASIST